MDHPQTWLEATQHAKEAQHIVSAQTRKPSIIPRTRPTNPTPPPTPLKIQKLTWDEMAEHQLKCLCCNCGDKYYPRHKCKEQNLFMAIFENSFEEDIKTPPPPPCDKIT
jgi:hypothetical protein